MASLEADMAALRAEAGSLRDERTSLKRELSSLDATNGSLLAVRAGYHSPAPRAVLGCALVCPLVSVGSESRASCSLHSTQPEAMRWTQQPAIWLEPADRCGVAPDALGACAARATAWAALWVGLMSTSQGGKGVVNYVSHAGQDPALVWQDVT